MLKARYSKRPAQRVRSKHGRGGGIRTPKNGFGDRRFTVEPTPLSCHRTELPRTLRGAPACSPTFASKRRAASRRRRLFHFPMIGVLAALTAKLAELETLRRRPAVLGGRVVLILAHGALQLTNFARHIAVLSFSRQRGCRALSGSEPGYRRTVWRPSAENFIGCPILASCWLGWGS
jgi:hypothetical protein